MARTEGHVHGPRGLGVDEATIRRWQAHGLIRGEAVPSTLRLVSGRIVADGQLSGFPTPHEEELPTVRLRAAADD
jgi:hypothetical protein